MCVYVFVCAGEHLRGGGCDGHVVRGDRDGHALVQTGVKVLRLLPLVASFLSGTPGGGEDGNDINN